jgi:hypothetical protein
MSRHQSLLLFKRHQATIGAAHCSYGLLLLRVGFRELDFRELTSIAASFQFPLH